MVFQRDIDLVVPLWQGGDDVRVAAGAAALARMVPSVGSRLHVSVPEGPREVVQGVRSLDVVAETVRTLRELLANKDARRVLTLGGDCLSDLAAAQHVAARHPDLVVYWFDAHADLNTPASSPSARAHGMVLRLLLGEGHPRLLGGEGTTVAPSRVTLVGTRAFDPAEADFVRVAGVPVVDPAALMADPARVVAGRAQGSAAYVHLDIDVIDPEEMPAVLCPVRDGVRAMAVAEALGVISSHHRLVGVGVSEFAPVIESESEALGVILEALGIVGS